MIMVAACQVRIDIDDPDETRRAVIAAVAEAAGRGAALIVVPELTLSGYAFRDQDEARARAEPASGPTVSLLRELSSQYGAVIIGGFCELGDPEVYNSAVILDRGEVGAVYRKTHLWDTEKLIFTPGDRLPPVVDTSVGRVAAMICYDLEFPEMIRSVALRGAQLIAAPSNWPDLGGLHSRRPPEVAKALAGAAINRVAIVVADRVGPERGVHWIGGSVICDPEGYPAAGPAHGEAVVLTAEVDLGRALDKQVSSRNHAFTDRRTDLY